VRKDVGPQKKVRGGEERRGLDRREEGDRDPRSAHLRSEKYGEGKKTIRKPYEKPEGKHVPLNISKFWGADGEEPSS